MKKQVEAFNQLLENNGIRTRDPKEFELFLKTVESEEDVEMLRKRILFWIAGGTARRGLKIVSPQKFFGKIGDSTHWEERPLWFCEFLLMAFILDYDRALRGYVSEYWSHSAQALAEKKLKKDPVFLAAVLGEEKAREYLFKKTFLADTPIDEAVEELRKQIVQMQNHLGGWLYWTEFNEKFNRIVEAVYGSKTKRMARKWKRNVFAKIPAGECE